MQLRTPRIQPLRQALETALVSALTGLMTVGPAALAHAGPEGASVQSGNVSITQTTPTDWEIRASDDSVIHYDRFDIAVDQWVRFVQDNSESRVLNRVFSENPTQILGRLSANGHVYLVNPSGVFIGNAARIDANGFHAAAGRISNEDFLARRERFTDLRGAVTNQGVISGPDVQLSDDGARVVALAGRQVTNGALGELLGRIYVDGADGWIVLAAGTDVLITSAGDSFAVQIEGALAAPGELQLANHGTLDANRGRVGLAAGDAAGLALFHTAVSQPDGSTVENGIEGRRILVQGGDDSQVSVAGTLDASAASGAGGQIEISGTRVAVQDALLDASGATSGGSVSISARDGGIASRAHAEAELSVSTSSAIDVSGMSAVGGSIALATEGALDYQTTNTNLDGAAESAPGTFTLQASELIVNGSAAAGQAAISSGVLAAQGSAAQGANLVLEGTGSLRVAAASDFSGARQSVALRGVVDSSAGPVTAAGDLSVTGSGLVIGDLTSQTGDIAIDGSDSVALGGRLAATEVSVDAGTGSSADAGIALGDGVVFEAQRVELVQDASIEASATSGVAAGDLSAIAARSTSPDGSLDYALRSRAGNVALASEGAREIDLVAQARGAISVTDADGVLEARSADLTVDGAWQPGFGLDVTGLAALRSGAAGSGDLTVSKQISAGSITLSAGSGTTSSADVDGAAVVIAQGAVLGTQALAGFRLEQDASIDQRSQIGAVSLANDANYELISRRGAVAVDADQLDKVSGERVTLESRQGVSLGFAEAAERALGEQGSAGPLGSLAIRSGDSLTVDYDVFTQGTDSSIELRAGVRRDTGEDISGDLNISGDRKLFAEHIALAAGDGQPNFGAVSGRVRIDPTVQFGRAASDAPLAPKSFSLEQDEALGGAGTFIPTRARLGTLSGVSGEDQVTLRSRLRSLTIDTAAAELLLGTHAVLGARTPAPGSEDDPGLGVRLEADGLDVKSLRVESDLIVDDGNSGGTDSQVDLISAGDIDLVGATPDTPGSRGNLVVRSGARVNIAAGGDVFAGRIEATSNPGATPASFTSPDDQFELLLRARDLDVSLIDASGAAERDGADVKVALTGDAVIGGILADAGATAQSNADLDGGTVMLDARNISVGNLFARGGLRTDFSTPAGADGGNVQLSVGAGGLIHLTGASYATRDAGGSGGVLRLIGDVELTPPLGSTTGIPTLNFTVGDLLANGAFRVSQALLANAQLTALIDASGSIDLQEGAQIGAGLLGLVANGNVTLGGDVSADGLIELIVDADGTDGGRILTPTIGSTTDRKIVQLASREIRLGAGDDSSSSSDAALDRGDLEHLTLAGAGGSGSPLRFQLVQDRAIDLDGEGTLIAANRFVGGIAGMEYAVGSRLAGVALSNAAVGGTHLRVSVAGTTSTATPDAANGDIIVAGGSLQVASAQLSADRDLRVGFGITTPGGEGSQILLAAGQGARGDLTVSSALRADEIALIAGRPGQTGSLVQIDPSARFFRGGALDLAPRSFKFEQDASITALPDLAALFPLLGRDGMGYALVSHTGDVTVSDAARVAGTQLSIDARDVAIRAALQVASLDVSATGSVKVESSVTATGNRPASGDPGTWAPSHIRLHAGRGGANQNLEIGAVALSADEIALRTGAQIFDPATSGSSRVTLAEGAQLGGLPGSRLARLTLEQEAAFGVASGASAIPTAFIDPDDLAGLDLTLISNSGEIRVASAAQVPLQGMALALHGARGVTLESGAGGGLRYASLLARVGSRIPTGGTRPSIALYDAVRTERGELNLAGDVRLVGAGDRSLVARGASGLLDGIVSVSGTLSRADGSVDGAVGDVSVEADDGISIAQIDVSGTDTRRNAGSVQVTAFSGLAQVDSVRAIGRRVGEQGGNGGNVEIDGAIVRIGSVATGAERGNAGSVYLGVGSAADRVPGTARVEFGGSLLMLGQIPTGSSIEQAGDLVVGAPLVLRAGGGLIDAAAIDLRGGVHLAGSGGVTGTGTETLRATARGRVTVSGDLAAREISLTGRGAIGEIDLRLVGNVLADRISLEAGEGGARILLPPDISFRDLSGEEHPDALRLAQDAALDFGGGANQLVTQDNLVDPGGVLAGMELALESRQGQVHVFAPAQIDGTLLTLRGAGATSVQVDGDLDVERLTLGAGIAHIAGDLDVEGNLAAAGNLEVGGERAAVGGQVDLTADQDQQVLRVGAAGGGTLALGGDVLRERTAGKGDLRLEVGGIDFTSSRDQRIVAHGGVASDAPAGTLAEGMLSITAVNPLVKAAGGLTLEADTGIDLSSVGPRAPDGSLRDVVETRSGALALRTRSGSTLLNGSLAASGGDLVADTHLDFRGTGESALRSSGAVAALQGASVADQDLVISSGSGVIRTGGDFTIETGAFRPDSDLVVERDTRIEATDVFLRGATGAADLSAIATGTEGVRVERNLLLDPTARLELGGSHVRLVGAGPDQQIEAGSVTLTRVGSGDPGVLVERTGNLQMRASNGNLTTSADAQMVATGKLELSASNGIQLGDSVAANEVVLRSDRVSSSASVLANRIVSTGAPKSGTFATPTGAEVSSELVSDRVVLRSIFADGRALSADDLAGFIEDGAIDARLPEGPALGDVSDDAAIWQAAPGVLGPSVSGAVAAAALAFRPLYADEVLTFLRRDPQARGALPDVAAGDQLAAPLHERLRTLDAERAAAIYQDLFRPTYATDPDAAIARLAELRALFAAAAEAERRRGPLDASALLGRIATDPAHAEALAVARRAADLLDSVRSLGLVDADYTELRTRLVGPLAPEGIDPVAFAEALEAL